MGTSLNSIMDANPELRKGEKTDQQPSAIGYEDFAAALSKMGMRHGKKDKELVQKAHDSMAGLVDGFHCAMDGAEAKARQASLEKGNARHSKKDLAIIKGAHDMIKSLGAECPSPHKETSEE